jgi:hypothetical protein
MCDTDILAGNLGNSVFEFKDSVIKRMVSRRKVTRKVNTTVVVRGQVLNASEPKEEFRELSRIR